jgi:hypothetical protein
MNGELLASIFRVERYAREAINKNQPLYFDPEAGVSKFLRNVDELLPDYAVTSQN